MSEARFHGVFPYVVSPLHSSGEVNAAVLARLCDDLIEAGVHGLTPLGSTGEFAYPNWQQRRGVVEVVLEAAKGRVPVVAGVAATTTADAVMQAREFERMGCAGILAILEAYFPLTDEGVFAYFRAVAEAVSIPVVLYTNPNFQRSDLSLAVIDRLSRIPNVKYIKDASFNTGRLLSIINRVQGRMQVFAASSHVPACVMLIGGVGWMAGPACVAPRQSVELYELCRKGDWAEVQPCRLHQGRPRAAGLRGRPSPPSAGASDARRRRGSPPRPYRDRGSVEISGPRRATFAPGHTSWRLRAYCGG